MAPMSQRLWTAALLGAMLLWFLPLGGYRLFNPDEGRYAEIPREMLSSGDWVTPRLDGLRYFEKPPLQYWATAAAYRLFGAHDWTSRLWAAATGFLGLVLTAWIGTRLYGARAGLLAALIQAGSLLYLALARISTLDMGLTATLEMALAGLLLLVEAPSTAPSSAARPSAAPASAAPRLPRVGALLLALGVALAFLSKGLVGLLIPGAAATLYLAVRRDWRLIARARPWWTLVALALLALPWVWQVEQRNPGFAQFFFVHEHFARFLTRVHARYEPDWFFIPVLLLGFMPWTPLLPAMARRSWRDWRSGHPASTLLVIWVLFGFAFFSLSQSKLIPYILPIFPGLALLAGRTLAALEGRRLQSALRVSTAFWLLLTIAAAVLWRTPSLALRLELGSGAAAPAIVTGLLTGTVLTGAAAWTAARRGVVAGCLGATLAALIMVGVLLPAANQLPRQRALAGLVAAARGELRADTAFYCVDDYEQSIPFYLQRPCTLVGYRGELDFGLLQEPDRWIPDLKAFADRWRAAPDALAVIRPASYAELRRMGLPMRVIYTAPTLVAVARH